MPDPKPDAPAPKAGLGCGVVVLLLALVVGLVVHKMNNSPEKKQARWEKESQEKAAQIDDCPTVGVLFWAAYDAYYAEFGRASIDAWQQAGADITAYRARADALRCDLEAAKPRVSSIP